MKIGNKIKLVRDEEGIIRDGNRVIFLKGTEFRIMLITDSHISAENEEGVIKLYNGTYNSSSFVLCAERHSLSEVQTVAKNAVDMLNHHIKQWGVLVGKTTDEFSLVERQRRLSGLIMKKRKVMQRFGLKDNVIHVDFRNKQKVA